MLEEVEAEEGIDSCKPAAGLDSSGWDQDVQPAASSNAYVLSTSIAAYALFQDWKQMTLLLERASTEQVHLIGTRLVRAVHLCSKAGEWQLVLDLMSLPRLVDPLGGAHTWSMSSYRAALKAARMLGDWGRAVDLLNELKELEKQLQTSSVAKKPHDEPWSADSLCFGVAMSACLKHREDGDALKMVLALFKEARQRGRADSAVYGCVMQAHVLLGERDKAWSVFMQANEAGIPLRTVELNIALGAGARVGKLRQVVLLLQQMRNKDKSLSPPDVGSYDAILHPLASAGRYDTLLRLFAQMHEDGIAPIEFHYRLAIGACSKLRNGSLAAKLLLRMQERGLEYSSAAANAMHACNLSNRPEVALDIFEAVRHSMHEIGGGRIESVYVNYETLLAHRQLGEVKRMVDVLTEAGALDSRSFWLTIQTCREHRQLELLSTVLATLVRYCSAGSNFVRSEPLHIELMRTFEAVGQSHRCLRLAVQLAKAEVPMSTHVFRLALRSMGGLEAHSDWSNKINLVRAHLVSLAVERKVFPQPFVWKEEGHALIDLSRHWASCNIVPVLHYAMARMLRALKELDVPLQTVTATIADNCLKPGLPPPDEVLSKELQVLRLRHEKIGPGQLHIEPSQFSKTELTMMFDLPNVEDDDHVRALEKALGPPLDELDVAIEGISQGFAPVEAWAEHVRINKYRHQQALKLKKTEDYRLRSTRSRLKSRWRKAMADGKIPWSTPSLDDRRARDNVLRARGLRFRREQLSRRNKDAESGQL